MPIYLKVEALWQTAGAPMVPDAIEECMNLAGKLGVAVKFEGNGSEFCVFPNPLFGAIERDLSTRKTRIWLRDESGRWSPMPPPKERGEEWTEKVSDYLKGRYEDRWGDPPQ
jgi:hypothetical protein